MKYRQLKTGEIIKSGDEYISVFSVGNYIPVAECTIGKELLACNEKYYRRPMEDIKCNN